MEEFRGQRQFQTILFAPLMSALSVTLLVTYLVLIARRIYGNPEISLAGLNMILYKRMEAGNGLFDDKTKLRAF